jgi:hypothetical protein
MNTEVKTAEIYRDGATLKVSSTDSPEIQAVATIFSLMHYEKEATKACCAAPGNDDNKEQLELWTAGIVVLDSVEEFLFKKLDELLDSKKIAELLEEEVLDV